VTIYNHGIKSSECKRCRLQINDSETECPHCVNLSDTDALKLKKSHKSESLKVNSELGKKFKVSFFITIFLMFLLYIV
jgi:hypothetical protein